jgi:hypothetical protein
VRCREAARRRWFNGLNARASALHTFKDLEQIGLLFSRYPGQELEQVRVHLDVVPI